MSRADAVFLEVEWVSETKIGLRFKIYFHILTKLLNTTMKKPIDNSYMKLADRQESIMEILRNMGSVTVSVLAERLNVSEVTIRKDLNMLEKSNMLYRAHGSAILIDPYMKDRHVNEKEQFFAAEKRSIGRFAANLITPHDTILIASGTTMMAFAREIVAKEHLTAITAAINVAMILAKDSKVDIIQLGGVLRNSSVSAVGPFAEQMLANFACSKLFIGVDGIDLDYGLTTTNMLEASLNRVMIDSVQKVIVLADSSKFGRKGFSKICDIEAVNQIITDSNISDRMYNTIVDAGIEVSIAP